MIACPATREAFRQAARWFVDTAATVDDWGRPGLGEWTVRDLVGHTSRALLTVEAYLGQASPGVDVDVASAADYYPLALAAVGDPALVAKRGRDAGAALGQDPAHRVSVIADRVLRHVDAAAGDAVAATPVGAMRLADYLPTRIFELTVHTCDLAASLGVPAQAPDAAASVSLHLLGDLALRRGLAGALLLAATGRGSLPAGFTVL
ncbi:MAG: maleylpyruvate isomerase N-terminal domain-containing protein [Ramlibacter sp.]|nr:maleylpyruvate isomerase N-terminal domain-containing protein [Cryobacterium sp.]